MKRFLILLSLLFCNVVYADTINLHWLNYDGTSYQDSTCVIDSDLILPATPPTRYGYTFTGWEIQQLYIPIEYLQSTGTQYIDTGVKVNSDYIAEVRGKFVSGAPVFGQEGSSWATSGGFNLFLAGSSGYSCWGNGSVSTVYRDLGINSDYNILKIDKYGVYINGFKKAQLTPPSTRKDSTKNFLLFATKGEYGWSSNIFLYVKIWNENNMLVRDFIPVLDKDGVPCMFDKVTQQFFYNQGTGNFIAGPIVNE